MAVPINKYVCFPKSAAWGEVRCTEALRRSKVLFAIQTGHSIGQVGNYICMWVAGAWAEGALWENTWTHTPWHFDKCGLSLSGGWVQAAVRRGGSSCPRSDHPPIQVPFVSINWGFGGPWSQNPLPTKRILAQSTALRQLFIASNFLSRRDFRLLTRWCNVPTGTWEVTKEEMW